MVVTPTAKVGIVTPLATRRHPLLPMPRTVDNGQTTWTAGGDRRASPFEVLGGSPLPSELCTLLHALGPVWPDSVSCSSPVRSGHPGLLLLPEAPLHGYSFSLELSMPPFPPHTHFPNLIHFHLPFHSQPRCHFLWEDILEGSPHPLRQGTPRFPVCYGALCWYAHL